MASEIYVETLKGLTSGANANKVIIPSGQTLDASAGGFTTPAGHVIQVVQQVLASQTDSTSTTMIDTGLSASITPSSTSSKILITVNHRTFKNSAAQGMDMQLLRDSTNLGEIVRGHMYDGTTGEINSAVTFCYLDSPSSTSSVTYKTQFSHNNGNGGTIRVCGDPSGGGRDFITLMEIAG